MSCAESFMFIFCDDNSIRCKGNNCYGQLGVGDNIPRNDFFEMNNLPEKIISIACGSGHSLFLGESKQVYSSGGNFEGELGYLLGSTTYNYIFNITPIECLSLNIISVITCYRNISFCIDIFGSIFTFGKFSGHNPTLIDIPPVKCINCGTNGILVQTTNEEFWEIKTNWKESKLDLHKLILNTEDSIYSGYFESENQSIFEQVDLVRNNYVSFYCLITLRNLRILN